MFTKREALALIERLRADGKTVVFTNGVFGKPGDWGTCSSSA